MGWMSRVTMVVTLQYIVLSVGIAQALPVQSGYVEENIVSPNDDSNIVPASEVKLSSTDVEEESKLQDLTNYLTYVLLRPWPTTGLPLVYIEEYPTGAEFLDQEEDLSDLNGNFDTDSQTMRQTPYKRSRYYRKYPWKRQNSRETYEAENRYLCQPSKDDVFRLLVALHEVKQGNRGHTVHFCNRKRPASAIFTNIRFLGKRK